MGNLFPKRPGTKTGRRDQTRKNAVFGVTRRMSGVREPASRGRRFPPYQARASQAASRRAPGPPTAVCRVVLQAYSLLELMVADAYSNNS